jgi:hypothetical protein
MHERPTFPPRRNIRGVKGMKKINDDRNEHPWMRGPPSAKTKKSRLAARGTKRTAPHDLK